MSETSSVPSAEDVAIASPQRSNISRPGAVGKIQRIADRFQFGVILVEYGLVTLVVWKFQLQNESFLELLLLAWAGVACQHFLPLQYRMPFFAGLSIFGIALVLGVASTGFLLGMSLALIGLAHIPAPFALRVSLLIGVCAGLAVLRIHPMTIPQIAPLWPVIGSMFMFRMIIYLYDLKHRSAPFSLTNALSYFFMLPNICFPLFPVVDYKTFCRSHYSGDSLATYQKGIEWMLRGVVHLLIYRLIYLNFMLGLADVTTAGKAAQFMATTFLRYLQVSGNFHLAVGMLCLFGFNMPDAFNRYLVSTSFTDFWRRVNIYWKDFMQKVFFNPVLFTLKHRLGATAALMAATAFTMFVTWALHSYQTFWISGVLQNKPQDILFWSFLGVMILINVYLENRFGRKRSLTQPRRSLASEISVGLRAIGMFVVIATAWTLWSANSVDEWLSVLSQFKNTNLDEAKWIAVGLLLLGLTAVVLHRFPRASASIPPPGREAITPMFWRSVVIHVTGIAVILTIGKWPLLLAPLSVDAAEMASHLRENKLNERDTQSMERGYYEDLIDVTRFNPELAKMYAERPADWNFNPTVRHNQGDYPPYDLHPSMNVDYKGALLSTNRWGMRDREYDQGRAVDTFRIAILGSSHTVGVGVGDAETFENLVEDRLNRELTDEKISRFEVLNFSVSGYGPMCRLATLQHKVVAFDPDLFIYVGVDDVNWVANEVSHAVAKPLNIPYSQVRKIISDAGIEMGLPKIVAEQNLQPYREEMLLWIYQQMVLECSQNDIHAAATFIPRPEDVSHEQELLDRQVQLATEAGFDILDTTQAYSSAAVFASLWIAKWDKHPNAAAHQLLANALYDALDGYLMSLQDSADDAVE